MIIKMGFENLRDINKPNQPFDIVGKIIPVYIDEAWSFSECLYENPYEKSFPNDDEKWEKYIDNPDKIIFLFYDGDNCVGQVRLRKNWNGYALIEDIAVSKTHRKAGIGKQLMQKSFEWAKANDLCGIMLETQDNNLSACRFYKKLGFKIGAVDVMLEPVFNKSQNLPKYKIKINFGGCYGIPN